MSYRIIGRRIHTKRNNFFSNLDSNTHPASAYNFQLREQRKLIYNIRVPEYNTSTGECGLIRLELQKVTDEVAGRTYKTFIIVENWSNLLFIKTGKISYFYQRKQIVFDEIFRFDKNDLLMEKGFLGDVSWFEWKVRHNSQR